MPREVNFFRVRDHLPVRYKVNSVGKFFSITLHLLISGWCLFVILSPQLRAGGWSVFYRVLPYVVLFVALDSLIRHLTALYAVIFTPECLWFRYLLKPSVAVEYDQIQSIELRKVITYYVFLTFSDKSGNKRILKHSAAFPKMMEIIYNIVDLAPQIVMDSELAKMVGVIQKYMANRDQA